MLYELEVTRDLFLNTKATTVLNPEIKIATIAQVDISGTVVSDTAAVINGLLS